jgi:hypothetical protein
MKTLTTMEIPSASPALRALALAALAALALLLLLDGPGPARAQQVVRQIAQQIPAGSGDLCLARGEMARLLDARFAETPAALGVTEAGGLVELFHAKDGATWSIILTTPQGRSCLLASGEGWSERPRPAPGGAT